MLLKTNESYGPFFSKKHMHTCTQNCTHNFRKFKLGISEIYVLHIKKNLKG